MPQAVTITVHAPVRPTEIPERVRDAVLNLFPDAELEVGATAVSGTSRSLDRIAELVANHQILDSARDAMLAGRDPVDDAVSRFDLGKQAAFVGKPNFGPPGSPLGEIHVEVRAESGDALERAFYEAAPDTKVPERLARIPPRWRPQEGADDEVS